MSILKTAILVACTATLGFSADRAKEEQALRAAIATDKTINDPSHWTDDVIFVSGRYPKPLLGKQQYEAANKRLQADPTERRANEQRRLELVRLEVAEAGDMAYEFSTVHATYNDAGGKRVDSQRAVLRVWKKVGGQWKTVVLFARPNQSE
jgi:ketosteroid isomerase-like protein